MSSDVGEVVITRIVQDGVRDVRIEVTDPRLDADTGDWRCTYRIDEADARVVRGRDSLTAVYSALVGIGDELAQLNADGAHYTVFGQADLGFPARTSGTAADAR